MCQSSCSEAFLSMQNPAFFFYRPHKGQLGDDGSVSELLKRSKLKLHKQIKVEEKKKKFNLNTIIYIIQIIYKSK